MVKRLLQIILAVLLCASVSFADYKKQIESMCRENWGSNLELRDVCIANQQNALEIWYENYFDKYVGAFIAADAKDPETTYMMEEANIVYECTKQYTDSAERPNFLLVLKCCDDRFEQYKSSKQ